MLSKEEIKNKINLKDRTKYAIEKSKNIIKEQKEEKGDCSIEVSLAYDMQYVEEYIDQLESDKQKLIEKLEEDIREEYFISKQKIKDKILYRQFELQQEYKDFEDDIVLNTLQELLEERN